MSMLDIGYEICIYIYIYTEICVYRNVGDKLVHLVAHSPDSSNEKRNLLFEVRVFDNKMHLYVTGICLPIFL